MRKTALALATLAVAAGPLAVSSQAALPSAGGCVTTYATYRYPAPTVVTIDSSGRIIIDPHGANGFAKSFSYRTRDFVDCVV